MIRMLLALLTVGLVGMAVAGIVFSLVVPILALAVKVAIFLLVGYLLLRIVNPKVADDLKFRVMGEGPDGTRGTDAPTE